MSRAATGMDTLRRVIERRQRRTLWTQPYFVTPRLLPKVFGDGGRLVGISTINHRPAYYVVCVDSAWTLSPKDVFGEHVEDVVSAIIDEFGEVYEREVPRSLRRFPAWGGQDGYSWFAIDWLDVMQDDVGRLLRTAPRTSRESEHG